MVTIAAVIPVFNEEANVHELATRTAAALGGISDDYAVLLVDDGSRDGTWEAILAESRTDARVGGLRFSRNFGQHYAISAGLDRVDAEWIVVMDGDLQDRPEVIPDLWAKAQEGFDVVFVAREERPIGLFYRLAQKLFYVSLRFLAGTEYDPAYGNFSIVSRRVVEHYRQFREGLRFYGGIVYWLGYPRTAIPAAHGERHAGAPAYSLRKRFELARDIIVAHSERPLYLAILVGLLSTMFAVGYGGYIVVLALLGRISVEGWPAIIVSIYFMGGIITMLLGIIGLYLGQTYADVKGRPLYVISDVQGPEGM